MASSDRMIDNSDHGAFWRREEPVIILFDGVQYMNSAVMFVLIRLQKHTISQKMITSVFWVKHTPYFRLYFVCIFVLSSGATVQIFSSSINMLLKTIVSTTHIQNELPSGLLEETRAILSIFHLQPSPVHSLCTRLYTAVGRSDSVNEWMMIETWMIHTGLMMCSLTAALELCSWRTYTPFTVFIQT